MSMTDPIADMLTRIRNSVMSGQAMTAMPSSKVKAEIAKILKEDGFIRAYKILKDKKQGVLRITLKYAADNEAVISGIKRISKPGRRVYADKDSIPTVMGGVGISVLSTSRGVLGDKTCRREKVGGEVLCHIW